MRDAQQRAHYNPVHVFAPNQASPRRFPWSLSVLKDLAQDSARCSFDAIRGAVARLEYDEAIARTLARVVRRETITPEMMATVIPYSPTPFAVSLIALADGNRATALVETSERGRFPDNMIGAAARALALHAAWYLDPALAERIAIQARRMATRWPGSADHRYIPNLIGSLLLKVEGRFGSEEVLADDVMLLEFVLSQDRPTVERILFRSLDQYGDRDEQPSKPITNTPFSAEVVGRGHAVNAPPALPKVGRNEPCPCGSGKKSKRCHGAGGAGQGLVASRSVSASDVRKMRSIQLAQLDLLALPDDALVAVVHEACAHGSWEHVDDAFAALMQRTSIPRNEIDVLLAAATESAVLSRSHQAARNYAAQLADPGVLSAVARAGIAIQARTVDAFEHLLRAADVAVRDVTHARHRELVSILLNLAPSLGLLLSRGCHLGDERDLEILQDKTDEARAELGLDPGDPGREIQAALRRDPIQSRALLDATQTIDDLRSTIDRLTGIRRELEQRIAVLERERELWQPRASVQEPSPTDADPAEVRRLRSKIDDLQDMVRVRNEVIAALRQQVTVTAAPEQPTTNVDQHPEYDDGEAWEEQAPLATRRLLVPTWSERAIDSLGTVPTHVAREALRTATELGAGDAAAWRPVKRAKRVAVFMSRVGIHYRLLFLTDGRALAVLDLVTRQSLDVALRRYS